MAYGNGIMGTSNILRKKKGRQAKGNSQGRRKGGQVFEGRKNFVGVGWEGGGVGSGAPNFYPSQLFILKIFLNFFK